VRAARLAGILLLGALLAIPLNGVAVWSAAPTGAHLPPPHSTGFQARVPLAFAPIPSPNLGLTVWNRTLSPALARAEAGEPVSAIPVVPTPPVDAGTPTIVTLATDLVNCCVRQNFHLPTGPWSRILLNYTGQAIAGVYDSSYRLYIDNVTVLYGTTPEYGTWTVTKDLTEYSAILQGNTNVSFLLGAALIGGHFLANLSLAYYPVPPDARAPDEPTSFVPLWFPSNLNSSAPTTYEDVTVPSDVLNASLEVWTYGFNPDEFWYSETPSYREITVYANGTPIAAMYPFPFINTGGIDLFLWRPVTAVDTLNDREQRFDLTGDLPLIEGHDVNLSARFTGISTGSRWTLEATLVLYESPNVTGVRSLYQTGNVTEAPYRSGTVDQSAGTATFSSGCVIDELHGSLTVASSIQALFSSNITEVSSGDNASQNISMNIRWVESTSIQGSGGATEWFNDTYSSPFFVELVNEFIVSKKTGGGYPEYGNFTTSFGKGIQEWDQATSVSGNLTGFSNATDTIQDEMLGANGNYSGEEELTGPNAGEIISVASIATYNPRQFSEDLSRSDVRSSYGRTVVSNGTDPPGPYNASAIITDSSSAPIALGGMIEHATLDVNASDTFAAIEVGGTGTLNYVWPELPPGCASVNSPVVTCTPSSTGSYPVSVTVTNASGPGLNVLVGSVLVIPDPTARVVAQEPGIDLGQTVPLSVVVAGGQGPFVCAWYVDGSLAQVPASCSADYNLTATEPGTYAINVTISDSDGTFTSSPVLRLPAVLPVAISIAISVPSGASNLTTLTVPMGEAVVLVASAHDGIAPFNVTWFIGDSRAGSGWELNYTVVVGTVDIFANISDAGLGVNQSGSLEIREGSSPSVNSSSGLSGSQFEIDLILILVAAALVVGALLWLVRPRRGPPERTSKPPRPRVHSGPPPS
jgi:Peptide N-acetyl-beta-D-glucosaminyl asparaginase amidase A